MDWSHFENIPASFFHEYRIHCLSVFSHCPFMIEAAGRYTTCYISHCLHFNNSGDLNNIRNSDPKTP